MASVPAYVKLFREGALAARVEQAMVALGDCRLCGRRCAVNRLAGQAGECRGGSRARISSAFAHHGEEFMIRGIHGSGTVFLAGCSLHCLFCQNAEISHLDQGREVTPEQMVLVLGELADDGCHNFNFVTPSHFLPQILETLALSAAREGLLHPPVVWNCGGYESLEGLELLDGVVDIYMPDFKFLDSAASDRYLGAPDYPEVVATALGEMFRQVGPVAFDSLGILQRGVLIRHLVMPGMQEDTRRIIDLIAQRFSSAVAVNIMGQYRPCFQAFQIPEISRSLPFSEWNSAVAYARSRGLLLA